MNNLEEVMNVTGFVLEIFIMVGGNPRIRYLHGSFNGNRNRLVQSLTDWHIQNIEGLQTIDWQCKEIQSLCEVWTRFTRRNMEFFLALNQTVNDPNPPAVIISMNLLMDHYNATDLAEGLDAFFGQVSKGAIYMKDKMDFGMRDAMVNFEVISRGLRDIERNLAMKNLTPREAAEKAKEIVKADSDLDESAQLFYNKKTENGDEEIGLRIVLETQTVTQVRTLSHLNGVNAANPGSLKYFQKGPLI